MLISISLDGGPEVKDSRGTFKPIPAGFGLLLSLLWLNISKPPLEKHFISAGLLKSAEFVANMISVVDKEKS